jgi:hypothetical protein
MARLGADPVPADAVKEEIPALKENISPSGLKKEP